MLKNLLYILPITIVVMASSCGSKDSEKDEKKSKKPETACDCMNIMLDEVKKIETTDQMAEVETRLNNEYPECDKMVDELFSKHDSPSEAAEECPAITELMNKMTSLKSSDPQSVDELLEATE